MKGRMKRGQYFLHSLPAGISTAFLQSMLNQANPDPTAIMVLSLAVIVCMVVYFRAAIGRCHDLGRSGWLSIVMFIPLISLILGCYLLFAKGQPEANKWGPPVTSSGSPQEAL